MKELQDLNQRPITEFVSYEHFANCVLMPKQSEVEPPFLCFNLFTRYGNAFNGLKQEFGQIIHSIHLDLAKAQSKQALKSEQQILEFD